MQFSGFAVSVRGASHEDSGTPCQDSARVLITDKLAVAAVSDGHGSEKHFRSASGSEMAARVALRSVTDFCERNGSLGAVFLHDPREAARRRAVHRTDKVPNLDSGLGEVELQLLLAYHAGVAGLALLWNARSCTRLNLLKGAHDELSAHLGELIVKLRAGHGLRYLYLVPEYHVAGVKPLRHVHRGNSGFFLAELNTALYRSRSAVHRQQRRVYVYAAVLRKLQYALRQ